MDLLLGRHFPWHFWIRARRKLGNHSKGSSANCVIVCRGIDVALIQLPAARLMNKNRSPDCWRVDFTSVTNKFVTNLMSNNTELAIDCFHNNLQYLFCESCDFLVNSIYLCSDATHCITSNLEAPTVTVITLCFFCLTCIRNCVAYCIHWHLGSQWHTFTGTKQTMPGQLNCWASVI